MDFRRACCRQYSTVISHSLSRWFAVANDRLTTPSATSLRRRAVSAIGEIRATPAAKLVRRINQLDNSGSTSTIAASTAVPFWGTAVYGNVGFSEETFKNYVFKAAYRNAPAWLYLHPP